MSAEKMKDKENPFGVTKNKFWDFIPAAGEKPPELLLYGAISSNQSWWEDRVTPQQFNRELAALGEDVEEIVVRIHSSGGDVFAANAIFTRLKDHKAHITVKIDGWAASAATIIAMAGDTIKIAKNGVFMIHDPAMTVWDTFTAEDFIKMADELKVIKQSIVNTYAMKTGRAEAEIESLMAEETWWTGNDAVENGFCDEIMFDEVNTVVENSSKIVVNSVPIDLSQFKTIPKQLLDHMDSFVNIGEKERNEKEEKGMEPSNNINGVEDLKTAYPDLVTAVEERAVAKERERIKAIKDLAIGGFENIIESAMFKEPISPEATAMKIINEQKKQGEQYLSDRNNDVSTEHVNEVGTLENVLENEKKNVFDMAIDKLFPEDNKGER